MSNFKEMREMLNLTQRELAEILGVEKSVISMSELNKRVLPTRVGGTLHFLAMAATEKNKQRLSGEEQGAIGIINDRLPVKYSRAAEYAQVKLNRINEQLARRDYLLELIENARENISTYIDKECVEMMKRVVNSMFFKYNKEKEKQEFNIKIEEFRYMERTLAKESSLFRSKMNTFSKLQAL